MPYVQVGEENLVVTASTTLAASVRACFVDATAAPVTVTLPPSAQARGLSVKITKIDASANAVTVAASTGDSLLVPVTLSSKGAAVTLFMPASGTVWYPAGGGGGGPGGLVGTATVAPGTLLAGQIYTTTVSVPGAQVGKPVVASHTGISDPAVILSAHVTAAGVVSVAFINLTGVLITIPSGTLTVIVMQ